MAGSDKEFKCFLHLKSFGSLTAGDKVNFDAAAVDGFDSFDLVERDMTTCTFTRNKMETSRRHAGLRKKQNQVHKTHYHQFLARLHNEGFRRFFFIHAGTDAAACLWPLFSAACFSEVCSCVCVRSEGRCGWMWVGWCPGFLYQHDSVSPESTAKQKRDRLKRG